MKVFAEVLSYFFPWMLTIEWIAAWKLVASLNFKLFWMVLLIGFGFDSLNLVLWLCCFWFQLAGCVWMVGFCFVLLVWNVGSLILVSLWFAGFGFGIVWFLCFLVGFVEFHLFTLLLMIWFWCFAFQVSILISSGLYGGDIGFGIWRFGMFFGWFKFRFVACLFLLCVNVACLFVTIWIQFEFALVWFLWFHLNGFFYFFVNNDLISLVVWWVVVMMRRKQKEDGVLAEVCMMYLCM